MDLALAIENPAAIRTVNMALLTGRPVMLYDPHRLLADLLGDACRRVALTAMLAADTDSPGVYVADLCQPLPPHILILRPPTLVAGIGCNRGTGATEIRSLLTAALADQRLSVRSLYKIASIDLKHNEPGLLALAQALGQPLHFYSADTLNQIHVPNPSAMAAKHAGVYSVCEAAAILGAQQGPLVVPKCKSPNTTVAIARRAFLSSASAPAVQTICPSAPGRCWPRPT
jgi:cobalt-precorrin 5A hydrolase